VENIIFILNVNENIITKLSRIANMTLRKEYSTYPVKKSTALEKIQNNKI